MAPYAGLEEFFNFLSVAMLRELLNQRNLAIMNVRHLVASMSTVRDDDEVWERFRVAARRHLERRAREADAVSDGSSTRSFGGVAAAAVAARRDYNSIFGGVNVPSDAISIAEHGASSNRTNANAYGDAGPNFDGRDANEDATDAMEVDPPAAAATLANESNPSSSSALIMEVEPLPYRRSAGKVVFSRRKRR